jgi:magnesium-transporting ATPase (P-type)
MNLVHINEQENNYYETIIHNFALKGYRSLAIAKKNDSRFNLVGLVALEDPIRPDAYKTVQEIKDLGITVKILTGDNVAIAQEVAKDVGLKGHIISFAQHSAKDYHALKTLIETSDGFADIFPKDKYAIVQMLQSNKNIVGMTGDGINDAPALRQAEVGIAVSTATDIARESASVVLTQPGLYNIIDLVKQGRSIFERVSTWIFNKITRTIFKIIFIMIPFLILGKFIISSSALLLLILMTDFVKLSLSTDNERISQHPSIWNIKKLTAIAAIIGLVMVIQALILLFIGLHYFNFDENQHIYTYSFAILFYFAVCSILIARERGYFWQSVPGKIFLISIVIDTIVGFIITSFGWLGFKAISPWWSLGILLYASMCTFLINDALKQALFKKYGR